MVLPHFIPVRGELFLGEGVNFIALDLLTLMSLQFICGLPVDGSRPFPVLDSPKLPSSAVLYTEDLFLAGEYRYGSLPAYALDQNLLPIYSVSHNLFVTATQVQDTIALFP